MVARTDHHSSDDRAEQQRQQRRAQIMQAAKEAFAALGYHNASINEIIRRAGIARGTFYLYFTGKQQVFDSILKEAVQQLRSRIRRIDIEQGAEPPQVQLRASLVRVVKYILGDPHFARLVVVNRVATDPEISDRAEEFFREVHEMIEHSLQHGIEMGMVRQCDTNLVAAALLGAVMGIVQHLVERAEPPEVDAIVDELIAFALRGVVNF